MCTNNLIAVQQIEFAASTGGRQVKEPNIEWPNNYLYAIDGMDLGMYNVYMSDYYGADESPLPRVNWIWYGVCSVFKDRI